MDIVFVLLAIWLTGTVAVLAVCRAAARGDHAMLSQLRGRGDTHEQPLAA